MAKRLSDYFLNEARRKNSDDDEEVIVDGKVVVAGKVKTMDSSKFAGKPAERNGSDDTFEVDAPTDDDRLEDLDLETITENQAQIAMDIDGEIDFFVIGRAGWAKTSIIKKTAKKFKRTVITVYLDKAVATDLDGIPFPLKGENGSVKEGRAMPAWADYMWQRPDEQFLLFFDEMNQAAPDVQNALMPIILDHRICNKYFKNYIVGAAGNFQSENIAINELEGPLKSRFDYITWETHTKAGWLDNVQFFHKKWDKKGEPYKKLIDVITDYVVKDDAQLFDNPRDVERYVLEWCEKIEKSGNRLKAGVKQCKILLSKHVNGAEVTGLSRTEQENALNTVADAMNEVINAKTIAANSTQTSSRKRTGSGAMSSEAIKLCKTILNRGWVRGETTNKFRSVTFDSLPYTVEITAEQVEWLKENAEKLGINAKYPTMEEAQKAKYGSESITPITKGDPDDVPD